MKKILTFGILALSPIWIAAIVFPETLLVFAPGEVKNVWLEASERDGTAFTIDTATSRIIPDGGTWSTGSVGTTTISGARMYTEVDATSWAESSGFELWVKWEVSETSETYISIVKMTCGEVWE